MKKLAVGISLLALAGCSNKSSVARARAAHAFSCPADSVQVTEIAGSSYEASGCGKIQVFTCFTEQAGGASCVPEGTAVPRGQ